MTHRYRTYENRIYVIQNITGGWRAFARALGEGMILDGFESREEAIKGMTIALWALNKFGVERYHSQVEELLEAGNPIEGVSFHVVDGPDEGKEI